MRTEVTMYGSAHGLVIFTKIKGRNYACSILTYCDRENVLAIIIPALIHWLYYLSLIQIMNYDIHRKKIIIKEQIITAYNQKRFTVRHTRTCKRLVFKRNASTISAQSSKTKTYSLILIHYKFTKCSVGNTLLGSTLLQNMLSVPMKAATFVQRSFKSRVL